MQGGRKTLYRDYIMSPAGVLLNPVGLLQILTVAFTRGLCLRPASSNPRIETTCSYVPGMSHRPVVGALSFFLEGDLKYGPLLL